MLETAVLHADFEQSATQIWLQDCYVDSSTNCIGILMPLSLSKYPIDCCSLLIYEFIKTIRIWKGNPGQQILQVCLKFQTFEKQMM